MNILYIGDIMGEVGIQTVEEVLPKLVKEHKVDVVIAQSENVTDGKGIDAKDFKHLNEVGIDFFTGGNWSLFNRDIHPLLNDPNQPIIRPANYPSDKPGLGRKYLHKGSKTILVISLLGSIVGKDAGKEINNPLTIIDKILDEEKEVNKDAIIVNFHGDYSSEKLIIGHYLDGQVTGVIGDHWHVPTADARVLEKGTAHITDVGMCGSLDSSLGIKFSVVIPRWRDNIKHRNELETSGKRQFNGVIISSNSHGLADSIHQIKLYLD